MERDSSLTTSSSSLSEREVEELLGELEYMIVEVRQERVCVCCSLLFVR